MPRNEIHRAALSADAERHLGTDAPCGGSEALRHDLDQVRVILIEESIERFPVEVEPQVDPRSERMCDAIERLDRDPVAPPELDARDDRLADSRFGREIDLAPPTAHAQRANATAESNEIHDNHAGPRRSPADWQGPRTIGPWRARTGAVQSARIGR